MRTQEQVNEIVRRLLAEYPEAVCALNYGKDYELLFSVRLSAQCTDAQHGHAGTLCTLSHAGSLCRSRRGRGGKIHSLLRILSRQGTGHRQLCHCAAGKARRKGPRQHGGASPPTRCRQKNGQPAARRSVSGSGLGSCGYPLHPSCQPPRLVDNLKEPEKIEEALRKLLPPESSSDFCHCIVLHGRAVCDARSPKCEVCCLRELCQGYAEGSVSQRTRKA